MVLQFDRKEPVVFGRPKHITNGAVLFPAVKDVLSCVASISDNPPMFDEDAVVAPRLVVMQVITDSLVTFWHRCAPTAYFAFAASKSRIAEMSAVMPSCGKAL